jgi:hypothetical protein
VFDGEGANVHLRLYYIARLVSTGDDCLNLSNHPHSFLRVDAEELIVTLAGAGSWLIVQPFCAEKSNGFYFLVDQVFQNQDNSSDWIIMEEHKKVWGIHLST